MDSHSLKGWSLQCPERFTSLRASTSTTSNRSTGSPIAHDPRSSPPHAAVTPAYPTASSGRWGLSRTCACVSEARHAHHPEHKGQVHPVGPVSDPHMVWLEDLYMFWITVRAVWSPQFRMIVACCVSVLLEDGTWVVFAGVTGSWSVYLTK